MIALDCTDNLFRIDSLSYRNTREESCGNPRHKGNDIVPVLFGVFTEFVSFVLVDFSLSTVVFGF